MLIFVVEVGPKIILDSSEYGRFAYFFTQTLLLASIISFGGQNLLVKEVAGKNIENKAPFIEASVLSIFIFLILTIAFYLLSLSFKPLLAGFVFSQILNNSVYNRCSGQTIKWYFYKDILRAILFVLIFFLLFLYSDYEVSADNAISAYLLSITIVVALVSRHLLYPWVITIDSLKIAFKKFLPRMKMSAPVIFTGFSYLLLARLDSFFIKEWLSFESLGDYSSVSRIMYQSLFIQQILMARELHKISSHFGDYSYLKGVNESKKLRRNIVVSTTLVSILLVFTINLEAVKALMSYDDIFWICVIFALSHITVSIFGLYGYLLLYVNKHYYEYFNCSVIIIVAIILYYLLIPRFGLIGAAGATSFSIVLGNILEWWQFRFLIMPRLKDGMKFESSVSYQSP